MGNSFNTIALDVGVVEAKLTASASATVTLGYTRGGEFNDNMTLRNIEVDGRVAPLKGEKVVESYEPTLTFNLLQMEADILDAVFAGVTVGNVTGTKTITRSLTIADSDYLHYVKYTGKTKAGKAITIQLDNVLATAPMNFALEDKSEVQIPVTFIAHIDPSATAAATAAPFSITLDETV